MIVGIDAREAAGPSAQQRVGAAGRARYTHELVRRLPTQAPDVRFLLYSNQEVDFDSLPGNVGWRSLGRSGLSWHLEVALRARSECDIYLSMSYLTPQLLPVYVQTVFDLITYRPSALPESRASRIERLTLPRAVRRARAILTISETTATDLRERFLGVADRVTVTPLAADDRFEPNPPPERISALKRKYGLPEAFILATGTLEPRKNLVRLVRAYGALPADLQRSYGLVLAGRKGWQYEPIFAAIAARNDAAVRHLDFVPDDDLATLYAAATVFCYPSLYEGFGLPVLEAMKSGTPVITSNVSSLPEVGGDAVRYVDPYDVGELARAMAEVLTDEAARVELRDAGLERAAQFSWDRTASTTMSVLRAAVD